MPAVRLSPRQATGRRSRAGDRPVWYERCQSAANATQASQSSAVAANARCLRAADEESPEIATAASAAISAAPITRIPGERSTPLIKSATQQPTSGSAPWRPRASDTVNQTSHAVTIHGMAAGKASRAATTARTIMAARPDRASPALASFHNVRCGGCIQTPCTASTAEWRRALGRQPITLSVPHGGGRTTSLNHPPAGRVSGTACGGLPCRRRGCRGRNGQPPRRGAGAPRSRRRRRPRSHRQA